MGKLRMSTSGGTKLRCSSKSACSTRRTCLWSAANRPRSCCAWHRDVKMSQQLRRSVRFLAVEGQTGSHRTAEQAWPGPPWSVRIIIHADEGTNFESMEYSWV